MIPAIEPPEPPPKRIEPVLHIALFGITYLIFLTYHGVNIEGSTRAFTATVPAAATNTFLQQSTTAIQPTLTKPPITIAREVVTPPLPASPKKEVSAEDRQKIRELSQTIAQSDDLNERANALRQLNDAPTEDAVQALAKTLQADPIARNRLLAISALRTLGMQGDADGRIRAFLRSAQNDTDTNVATNAADAYQQIESSAANPQSQG